MLIEYFRLRPDVEPPIRANPSDAGLDVFWNPPDIQTIYTLEPGENHLFETGLVFGVPHGHMLQVCNRSSMGSKKSLVVGAHIIDPAYSGEVFIDLHNIGKESQIIHPHEKIAQLVMVPVVHFRAVESGENNLYDWCPIAISNRGDGGFGSTDS